jgi:hypothetical protein
MLAAAAGVLAVYGDTTGAGLIWEDYTKLRPAGPSDVAAAFAGSWDPTGLWPAYYRPLSTAYTALAFYLFGLNAPALHVVSILGLMLAATLVGLVVRHELRSTGWGGVAAALYASHPFVLLSIGPWVYLQFQLLASLALLAAVLTWQRRPPSRVIEWWPICALAMLGFLIKEDTILVLPGLVAAQALKARVLRDVPAPGARVMLAVAAVIGMALVLRQVLLGQWGGQELPTVSEAIFNTIRGPMRVLGRFRGMFFEISPGLVAASIFFAAVTAAGSVLIWKRRTTGRGLWLLALGLGLFVNAPLTMMSTNTRYHLLTICAVLGAAACLHAIAHAFARLPRVLVPAFVAAGIAVMILASRDALVAMRPCQEGNLFGDVEMLEIDPPPLPQAIRRWLADKPRACASGAYADLVNAREPVQWGEGTARVVTLFPLIVESALLEVRDRRGSVESREVEIFADERFVARMTISSDWTRLPIEVPRNVWTTLRHAHRVDVRSVTATGRAAIELRLTVRSGRTPSGA